MSAGSKNLIICTTLKVALVLALPFSAALHSQAQTSPKSIASASSRTTQSGFATPQEAAEALIKAAGSYDLPALKAMFGPDSEDLVSTPDPVQDKNQIAEFAEGAQKKHSVEIDPKDAGHATLLVGEQDWPLPIPLAKKGTNGTSMQRLGAARFFTGASEKTSWTRSKFVGDMLKRKRSTLRPFTMIPGSISTHNELSARPENKTVWLGETQMAARVVPWEKLSPKR